MINETNFAKLTALDVSAHVEKKQTGNTTLSYLSWAWAWDYFKKAYPDAVYSIKETEGKPYLFDEKAGYMVQTSITAGGETHTMWLPVMDGANNAMLDKPYQITTKYGKTIDVKAATMFDINKTLMRCLVKNMAMFGLGLYIYAGEDLPEVTEAPKQAKPIKKAAFIDPKHLSMLNTTQNMDELDESMAQIKSSYGDSWQDVRAMYVPLYKKREKELSK